MLIFVVVEKFTKNGAYDDNVRLLPFNVSFGILKKNFKVLNSFEFKLVSVLCISLAISLKNNFKFPLTKFKII
jgi:hypothetical protein